MANLESYATRQYKENDKLWSMLSEAVLAEIQKPQSTSQTQTRQHKLIVILNSCLELSTAFKEFVQQLKEAFLQQGHLPFAAGGLPMHRSSNASTVSSTVNNNRNSIPRDVLRKISESGSSSKTLSSTQVGISLGDIEQITNELGDFSTRVAKVLDIISTLSQFRRLNMYGKLEGLPRIASLWDLIVSRIGDDEECSSGGAISQGRSVATSKRESLDVQITVAESEGVSKSGSESDITFATPDLLEQLAMRQRDVPQLAKGLTSYPLCSLKEESRVSSLKSCSTVSGVNEKGMCYILRKRLRVFSMYLT